VTALTAASVALAWIGLPRLDYLPESDRDSIFARFIPPPGYNLHTLMAIGERVEAATRPHWIVPGAPASTGGTVPAIDAFTFWASRGSVGVSVSTPEQGRARELMPLVREAGLVEPGTFGIVSQPSVFNRGIGGRSITIDIRGPDLDRLLLVARDLVDQLQTLMPRQDGHQVRPEPGIEYGAPEIRLYPDRVRLADADVTARDLAETVDAFNHGVRVSEITVDGRRIDLTLKGPIDTARRTQSIETLPIVTGRGQILPAQDLATVVVTAGPMEIRRVERQRAISIHVTPAAAMPLEVAMEIVAEQVLAPLAAGGLPPGVTLAVTGSADQLRETFRVMLADLALALIIVYLVMVILYLVMAILFESFLYPLVIMVSVPIAAAGGVLGLVVLGAFTDQRLDMLTLLGFVILIGIVVNNAILIVHQALYNRRSEGLPVTQAILTATRDRLRPIFMSTTTTVAGMMPLLLAPGAGAEIYRGIGAVIVGGLSLSAVLTLFLVPPLLALVMGGGRALRVPARGPLVGAPAAEGRVG
jgi:HAE1 family hydrophobic/amphiphilic exporter-1